MVLICECFLPVTLHLIINTQMQTYWTQLFSSYCCLTQFGLIQYTLNNAQSKLDTALEGERQSQSSKRHERVE